MLINRVRVEDQLKPLLPAVIGIRQPATSLNNQVRGIIMLSTIAVILIVLWLLGLVTGYTIGNFIHILLVIAIIIVLIRVIQGRKIL